MIVSLEAKGTNAYNRYAMSEIMMKFSRLLSEMMLSARSVS